MKRNHQGTTKGILLDCWPFILTFLVYSAVHYIALPFWNLANLVVTAVAMWTGFAIGIAVADHHPREKD